MQNTESDDPLCDCQNGTRDSRQSLLSRLTAALALYLTSSFYRDLFQNTVSSNLARRILRHKREKERNSSSCARRSRRSGFNAIVLAFRAQYNADRGSTFPTPTPRANAAPKWGSLFPSFVRDITLERIRGAFTRGCERTRERAQRGLSDDDAWTQFCFSRVVRASLKRGGHGKRTTENPTGSGTEEEKKEEEGREGERGREVSATSRDDVDKALALSGGHVFRPCPNFAVPRTRHPTVSLFILNSGVNTVAYSNAGATLCPAIRR